MALSILRSGYVVSFSFDDEDGFAVVATVAGREFRAVRLVDARDAAYAAADAAPAPAEPAAEPAPRRAFLSYGDYLGEWEVDLDAGTVTVPGVGGRLFASPAAAVAASMAS